MNNAAGIYKTKQYNAVCVGRIIGICVCVLLLQDLLQSCARGGRRRVEDMCYERRRAEACVDESAHHALDIGWFSVYYYMCVFITAVRYLIKLFIKLFAWV